jgi:hypothetical protein
MTRCFYNEGMFDGESRPDGRFNIEYTPIAPVRDSVDFLAKGRLILEHGGREGYPRLIWADSQDDIHRNGWVVGIEK